MFDFWHFFVLMSSESPHKIFWGAAGGAPVPFSPDHFPSRVLGGGEAQCVGRPPRGAACEHFWNAYRPLLPSPSTMGHPLLLPPPTVRAIQHTVMEAAILPRAGRGGAGRTPGACAGGGW